MSKARPAPLPPGTELAGYRVLRRLSSGGFGIVYLALDAQGRPVALKEYLPASLATREPGQLHPAVDPQRQSLYRLGLKSFFEEARALAQVSHGAVVGVQDIFREHDTVYLVMDLLQGATLQDYIATAVRLQRPKVLRESTIRSLFDEILRGLRIVHQHRMLHLDIKPANLFVTDDDRAVLIDFGAARQVLANQGRFIRPMYTPGFAAPEMYRRDLPLGPWTDIYAIGASLFACMAGAPPPDAPSRQGPGRDPLVLRLEALRGTYSDNLIEVVAWCMTLDALARPQSVFSLQKELAREGERHYGRPAPVRRAALRIRHAWHRLGHWVRQALTFGP